MKLVFAGRGQKKSIVYVYGLLTRLKSGKGL